MSVLSISSVNVDDEVRVVGGANYGRTGVVTKVTDEELLGNTVQFVTVMHNPIPEDVSQATIGKYPAEHLEAV